MPQKIPYFNIYLYIMICEAFELDQFPTQYKLKSIFQLFHIIFSLTFDKQAQKLYFSNFTIIYSEQKFIIKFLQQYHQERKPMEITEQDKNKLAAEENQNNQVNQIKKQPETKPQNQSEDGSDSQNQGVQGTAITGQKKKKKKKKNNKKKKKPTITEQAPPSNLPVVPDITPEQLNAAIQTNERFRVIKGWQTPVKFKFPNNQFTGYPENETMQYAVPRVKSQQLKAKEELLEEKIQSLRKAAEIQRQVRRFAQRIIKPGRRLADICEDLENYNRTLAPQKPMQSGIAFPTGISINNCAAHYTPNPGDETVLKYDDVCKIDFGTHINGRIIDTAFTVAFNPVYDNLLLAVKDATSTGIKEAGIDARLSEIGQKIQETMESYEVEINGKVHQVKTVKNLNGHSIDQYKIHGGKSVPCVKTNTNVKMQEGELYAIQTFGSTGKGYVKQEGDCSHYMKDFYLPANVKIPARSKAFYNYITQNYSTLCFCKRWLEREGVPAYILPLRDLVQNGIINPYPPLCDIEGSYVAQFEHTFILRPTCKEILSRGEDY